MQERNRESSKRSHKSRFDARRVSKKNSSKAKSKELNPVEKRNQRIEENKKRSGRADNRPKNHLSKKTSSLKKSQKADVTKKPVQKTGKGYTSKKTASKKAKSARPNSNARKIGSLIFNKTFKQSQYAYFGFGLIFAYLFLLISSVDTVISEGLFFSYLGVLLLKRPRIHSQGIIVDIFAIGIVFYSLCAFLPNLPYFFPDWRASAWNQYGISLGFLGTIMPLKSLEAIIMLVASIVFYYHIASWKLNNLGREVLLIMLVGISALAGIIQYFAGNDTLGFLFSENYERSPIKGYSDNLNLIYLVGGLGAVALFFDSLKSNKLVSALGFSGALLNLFFLINSQSVFYFSLFYGLSCLLIIRLYLRGKPIVQKLFTILILITCLSVFISFNQIWLGIITYDLGGFLSTKAKELWWVIWGSFKQLNIFGNGIATAHAILPQLSPLEYFTEDYSYRGSYLLAFISDFGFFGFLGLILFLNYLFSQYSRISKDSKIRHRFYYALIIMAFLTRFVTQSEGLSVGLLLLFLIFLHLSLRIEKDYFLLFSKKSCQRIGVFWLCLGMFWVIISIFNLPLLSDIRYRLSYAEQCDANVDFKALSLESIEEKDSLISKTKPSKYFLKAYQLLESGAGKSETIETLYQSAFFDRNNPKVFLQFGYLASDYDLNLANDTWFAYFEQNALTKLDDYISLIYYSKDRYELLLSLERLSYLANEYAVEYALVLNDLDFQKYVETNSLDRFFVSNSRKQFYFLKRLLEEGFFDKYSEYVAGYKNEIIGISILEAVKQKELANFEQALFLLREHIVPEKIDIFEVKEGKKYIPRVFLQNYPDVEMGMVLIKEEINEKNYEQALIYVDHILSMDNPPKYAYYWKAEVLYRMNEYIDSWFAFMTYLEKANIPQFPKNQ